MIFVIVGIVSGPYPKGSGQIFKLKVGDKTVTAGPCQAMLFSQKKLEVYND